MKKPALSLVVAALSVPLGHTAQITNVIDNLTTTQVVSGFNTNVTDTLSSPGSLGGYRTLVLDTVGGSPTGGSTFFGVDGSAGEVILNTPGSAVPSFQIIWGGEGGTNGLGGIDFGAGQTLDLSSSILSFSLGSADAATGFTWTFTDTFSNIASYTGVFPAHSSANPALAFDITLASFDNTDVIDWNSIDFISLSGGNAAGFDMTMPGTFQVVATTVPEPGTWALLAAGLTVTVLALRRRTIRGR